MDIQTNEQSLATIARRIDAIIAELQALKQQVQIIQPQPNRRTIWLKRWRVHWATALG
ncbi:MAG: hypothetical protein R6X18_07380 [Chloroflexota bacterium]